MAVCCELLSGCFTTIIYPHLAPDDNRSQLLTPHAAQPRQAYVYSAHTYRDSGVLEVLADGRCSEL